jgi:hypothetical protein
MNDPPPVSTTNHAVADAATRLWKRQLYDRGVGARVEGNGRRGRRLARASAEREQAADDGGQSHRQILWAIFPFAICHFPFAICHFPFAATFWPPTPSDTLIV